MTSSHQAAKQRVETSVLVVLATQLRLPNGSLANDADLINRSAIGVNYFVRHDVAGRSADEISLLVDGNLVATDGRTVNTAVYADQLNLFATAPIGTLIVTRTKLARSYLTGTITGAYNFNTQTFADHPHVREVAWGGRLPTGTRLDGHRYTTVRWVRTPNLRTLVAKSLV